MKRGWLVAAGLGLAGLAGGVGLAQVANPPFFNSGPTGFEAQISSISSGPLLSSTAVVSADRKYVTVGQRATIQQVKGFQSFSFVGPSSGGFVGTTGATSTGSVLNKTGMTLISARP